MISPLFLSAMRSFVAHCPELLTEDVIRRLMTPIECAMTMMAQYVLFIKATINSFLTSIIINLYI